MNGTMNKYINPKTGIAFFLLVAVLSSQFASWGMTGITIAVLASVGVITGSVMLWNGIKHEAKQMLEGKANKTSFLLTTGPRPRKTMHYQNVYAIAEKRSQYSIAEVDEEDEKKTRVLPNPVMEMAPARSKPSTKKSGHVLELAYDFRPDIDDVLGKSILGIGIRGSGKTNTSAKIIEEVGKYTIPMVIFDYEGDYTTLPEVLKRCVIAGSPGWIESGKYEGYWEVDETNAMEVGYEVLEQGVQLVLQLGSYKRDLNMATRIMVKLIEGLFEWAEEREPSYRVPCLVFLDEAQHFLPENHDDGRINKEESNDLMAAFDDLNSRGRKRGLTPCIFTQRMAQINKRVVSGAEIIICMKQTLDIDLTRVEKQFGKEHVNRQRMASFKKGEALVSAEGEMFEVKFDERKSTHKSITPGLSHAVKRYSGRPIGSISTPSRYAAEEEYDDEEEVDTENLPTIERRTVAPVSRVAPVKQKTELEIVVGYFKENPTASCREAASVLRIGGKDKIAGLLKEAKERELL